MTVRSEIIIFGMRVFFLQRSLLDPTESIERLIKLTIACVIAVTKVDTVEQHRAQGIHLNYCK